MPNKTLPDPTEVGGKGLTLRQVVLSKMIQGDPSECWMSTATKSSGGYPHIGFNKEFFVLSRLVYHCLVEPLLPEDFILHSCDNRACVNPAHLRTGTVKDNHDDMWSRGRARPGVLHGEKNGRARLTRAQVDEMRSLYASGGWTYHSLAPKYGVAWQTIADVISGKNWR